MYNQSNAHENHYQCQDQKWYVFLCACVISHGCGVLSIALYRALSNIFQCGKCKHSCSTEEALIGGEETCARKLTGEVTNHGENKVDFTAELKDWSGQLISCQTITGRLLLSSVCFLSIGSVAIYLYELSLHSGLTEVCLHWIKSVTQQIDMAFNLIFAVYFFLRFLASNDKLSFWFELFSIVDLYTLPPSVVTAYYNRYWIGLRFLRSMRLMSLTDVLGFMNIIKSNSAIRLCHLITTFASLVLAASGLIHLVEWSGDVSMEDSAQNKTFGDYIYFIIVTISTVGYGDIVVKTSFGKLLMVFLILGGLALFANSIPEMMEIIGNRNQFGGVFRREQDKQHIVLCGHITAESVSHFLADFLHKDRQDANVQIAILNNFAPGIELRNVLKRYFTEVSFFQGSVMSSNALSRVQLQHADACLILVNKYTADPDAEDAANIMRVISVKNFCPKIKVIVQLMQYHNKAYLLNIPSWDWKRGDDVVCFSEMKLGFIAQSCIAPGFSTLLANLFTMRSFKVNSQLQEWVNIYCEGAGMEMYTEYLSPAFHGLTFSEAVKISFKYLKLLLIAIETKSPKNDGSSIAINPKDSMKIQPGMQGFFIAQSADESRRAFIFCGRCHFNTYYKDISLCSCAEIGTFHKMLYNYKPNTIGNQTKEASSTNETTVKLRRKRNDGQIRPNRPIDIIQCRNSTNLNIRFNEQVDRRFDSTGMFHWCQSRPIETVLLNDPDTLGMCIFSNHIVVCIFADYDSPLIGLRNFVMPLRASNFHYSELNHIVFLANLDFMKREWKTINNFPCLSILPGSPLSRSNLRAVNINMSKMCIVLSSRTVNHLEDACLVDKEAIMCSLNVQAMSFDKEELKFEEFPELYPQRNNQRNEDELNSPKEGIFKIGSDINMITELSVDSNVQFLDQDDDDSLETEFFLTQPFACGRAFAISVLDSFMSTSYFNENALTLIRTLITGGATPELEQVLAEGKGIQGSYLTPDTIGNRDRCRIQNFYLDEEPLSRIYTSNLSKLSYGILFIEALQKFGILCIGVYRLINCSCQSAVKSGNKRYVITNPSENFEMNSTDMVYCLQPFNVQLKSTLMDN